MKSIFKKIAASSGPFKVTRKDFLLILLPSLIWGWLAVSRPTFLSAYCGKEPALCTRESINPADRLSLGIQVDGADHLSYTTQNSSGLVAFSVPLLWSASQAILGKVSPLALVSIWVTDLALLTEVTVLNGLSTEISHHFTHRPRPFVYDDPSGHGANPSHYVSFYSGHTSFSSAIITAGFLILLTRGAPLFLLILYGAIGEALIFSTGYLRIMAARHFLTDVICGIFFGAFVAFWVIKKHQNAQASVDQLENKYFR